MTKAMKRKTITVQVQWDEYLRRSGFRQYQVRYATGQWRTLYAPSIYDCFDYLSLLRDRGDVNVPVLVRAL